MRETPRHLLSINDLTKDEISELSDVNVADKFSSRRGSLGLLFQQPSLRTMASFSVAATRIGLTPISLQTTGCEFRERIDWEDEIHQLSLLGVEGVVVRSANPLRRDGILSRIRTPVINAGDGTNEHPTQALVDIATLRSFDFDGKKIALVGNAKDNRAIHSFLLALEHFDIDVTVIAPADLIPNCDHIRKSTKARFIAVDGQNQQDEILSEMDFIYVNSLQFYNCPRTHPDASNFDFSLARAKRTFKSGTKLWHPFPRLGQIAHDLDYSPYDAYHLATSFGPRIRENVLRSFLGIANGN